MFLPVSSLTRYSDSRSTLELVSDQDPRLTAALWQSVFRSLGTRLTMSTSNHPDTDGQTERLNRVLEDASRIRPIFHKLEQIFANGGVCYQQLRACIDNAYTILREWLTPSTPTHPLRV